MLHPRRAVLPRVRVRVRVKVRVRVSEALPGEQYRLREV